MSPKNNKQTYAGIVGYFEFGRRGQRTAELLLGLLMLLCTLQPPPAAAEVNDLLLLPAAELPPGAPFQVMDIANTGDRLVAVGERGFIFYSENQGDDWVQASVPASVTLTAVDFPSTGMGWAVGHDGVILHSTDGGKSWVKQLDGGQVCAKIYEQVQSLHASKQKEVNTCDPSQRQHLEEEVETLDFFLTDIRVALKEGPSRPLMDVLFINERVGMVVGSFGMILRTEDGGKNWLPILDRIENPEGLHYYGIARAGEALLIAGEKGMLHRSMDEGLSWEKLESPYDGSFFGIAAAEDGSIALAFGLLGNIWSSKDLGEQWKALNTKERAGVGAAAAMPAGWMVLVDYSGQLIFADPEGTEKGVQKTNCRGCTALAPAGNGFLVLGGAKGLIRVEPQLKKMD